MEEKREMNAAWMIPFSIIGAALQSCGAAMNGQLNKYVVNPWLASAISFALIRTFNIPLLYVQCNMYTNMRTKCSTGTLRKNSEQSRSPPAGRAPLTTIH
jgi:hypothetical protein